jgi:hypothetical protein
MMFSQSGRLIKKKKTTVKVGTKDPVFNETLNFEVNMSFNFHAFFVFFLGCSRPAGGIQVLGYLVQQETGG